MSATYRVRYISIKHDDLIQLGDIGTLDTNLMYYASQRPHIVIGYKPGPGPRAEGWLVVLVREGVKGRGNIAPRRRRRAGWSCAAASVDAPERQA